MTTRVLRGVIPVVAIVLALSGQGVAGGSPPHKLEGLINHYTAALDADGPWHISGTWAVRVDGDSGQARFSAALSMVRSENAVRQPHTHHVTIVEGDITPIGTGFAISGTATVTGNGNLAFTEPVEVEVTGGNTLRYSNVSVTFTGTSGVSHFGADALQGVVTGR